MSNSKINSAWEKLFEKYSIIENINNEGLFKISSKQINEFHESRLMTKFDNQSQLPNLFSDNKFSILPITRGDYLISDFQTFHEFNTDHQEVEIEKIIFPNYIESLDYNNITSEATALNCAFISGIIEDFSNDENLQQTISGRKSSQSFAFDINTQKSKLSVKIENSQIEIDCGYEGANSLCIFEAKNVLSDDFLIRQLYYPYRLWRNKVNKDVKTIFSTYSNGIFHLR